jgi:hypothetical protein
MDQDKMSNLYRGPSIDASYQVSVHIAEGFQRRRLKCEKLMDYRRQTPSDGKSSHGLWQGELIKKWPYKRVALGGRNLIRGRLLYMISYHYYC